MGIQIVPHIVDGHDVIVDYDGTTTTFLSPNDSSTDGNGPVYVQGSDTALSTQAVESCARAFDTWRSTRLTERRDLFLRLASVFRENAEELRLIVLAELSCSTTWADINVNDTIALAEHAATLASSSVFSEKVPNVRNPSSHATVNVVPLGVVLGIAPWNAPAILGLRAIAAPVMAGNCVIFKGSEYSPRTHHFIAKAFRTAGFPPGVVNFVMHEPKHAASLFETIISHSKVRKCNFTGSTAVGRHIAMKAACYLKPVLLELGGKNFAIVLDDADLDEASEDIIIGAFPNAGQICMSTDMVLATEAVKNELAEILCAKLHRFSEEHVRKPVLKAGNAKMKQLIEDASAKGARTYTAHNQPAPNSHEATNGCESKASGQYSATLIENVTPEMNFWTQESFGPVLGLAACSGLSEAIDIVNSSEYGLSAAIFTKTSNSMLHDVASRLEVSVVHVNGATVHDEAVLPHGGFKNSGWGRFGGEWGILEFVQTQTTIINY